MALTREEMAQAAELYARSNATIACWEAKYHYWLLRPEHADSTITRPFGVALPNFPAYPSGHACTAGAAETGAAAAFHQLVVADAAKRLRGVDPGLVVVPPARIWLPVRLASPILSGGSR